MIARSRRAEVRNPVIALPAVRALAALDPALRALLAALLLDLQRDARARADHSWKARKAVIAAYWSAVAVYAGHIARCVSPAGKRGRTPFVLVQPGFPDQVAGTWADASSAFSARREMSGLGASEFPEGALHLAGVAIARVSYNGRIWPLGEWTRRSEPIYDIQDQQIGREDRVAKGRGKGGASGPAAQAPETPE